MVQKKEEKLILIDTMGIIHRAFYAYPPLTTKDGDLVNALYGFCIMFLQIIKQLNPDYIVFATDIDRKTFRSEKYKEYKANRSKMDEGLKKQINLVYEFIKEIGFDVISYQGYEADDVIGSIATMKGLGVKKIIVTGDKDLLQLIDDDISVILPGKTFSDMKLYNEVIFEQRFGFKPKYYIHYKAIVGDPSDNIIGAKGVGEKTATDLIQKFNTLNNIYDHMWEVKSRYASILVKDRDSVLKNLDIVEIFKDLDVDFDLTSASVRHINYENMLSYFKKYEFNSLVKNIPNNKISKSNNRSEIDISFKLKENLSESKNIFFIKHGDKYILFNDNYEYKVSESLPNTGVFYSLKLLFESNKDALHRDYDDLQIMAYCQNPSNNNIDVKTLYKSLFHDTFEDENQEIPFVEMYCFIKCYQRIDDTLSDKQRKLYKDVDLQVQKVIFKMEEKGIKVDKNYLNELEKLFEGKIESLTKDMISIVGHDFNPNSPKELSVILFDELKLPKNKKIKTGFSTNERTISKLIDAHPIINLILEYREYTKLLSTYAVGLQKVIKNGRIHTDFRQTTVATGRLSSINPNLQNIPVRSENGELIRKAFVPDEGFLLLSLDYSQIELRLMAHVANDEALIKAFNDNKDIHTITASLIFNISESNVTSEQRRVAKMINFGIIYGISDFGLSDRLGNVNFKEAKDFIDKYFEKYPNVKKYFDTIKNEVEQNGYVETMFGRRRYFNINAGNYMLRQAMYREAINMPIQGADADIVKMAMIEVENIIESKYKDSANMLLQIHDELLIEITENIKEDFINDAKSIMEHIVNLQVPLIVNHKIGNSWGNLK